MRFSLDSVQMYVRNNLPEATPEENQAFRSGDFSVGMQLFWMSWFEKWLISCYFIKKLCCGLGQTRCRDTSSLEIKLKGRDISVVVEVKALVNSWHVNDFRIKSNIKFYLLWKIKFIHVNEEFLSSTFSWPVLSLWLLVSSDYAIVGLTCHLPPRRNNPFHGHMLSPLKRF